MRSLLRLVKFSSGYIGWLLAATALSLLTLLANVGLLALSGWFIASMALTFISGVPFNYGYPAVGIRAMAVCRTAGRYAERVISHQASLRILAGLRLWIYNRIEPLAPAKLENYASGDLLSRVRADIDTLDTFYLRLLGPVLTAIFGSLFLVIFLWFYNAIIATVTMLLLFISGFVLPLLLFKLGRSSGEQVTQKLSDLRSTVVDSLRGADELLIYGAVSERLERLNNIGKNLQISQRRLAGLNGISGGGVAFFAGVALWIALFVSIPLIRTGSIKGAEMVMLALFCLAAFEAVQPLPAAFCLIGQIIAAASRIFSLADEIPTIKEPDNPLPKASKPSISIRNVSFSYNQITATLTNINLELMPGKKIAIVGASGSGKSSILGLLQRFYEYDSGAIMLGDAEIRKYSSEYVRSLLSVVSQKPFLFNTTIRENLLIAKADAVHDEIVTATKIAGIHDEIMLQPDGYDSSVGEGGVLLSGGQVRRLAIARAILKGAPILLLDEPTEGMDATAGQILMERISAYADDKALLVITHNNLGLDIMDEVLVMDNGQIVRENY